MFKVVICSNDETICDGYAESDDYQVVASAYTEAASDVLADARSDGADVDYEYDSFFPNWHGGKHARCDETVAGKKRGYRSGLVCCHGTELPDWLCKLIDAADEAGQAAREQESAACERLPLVVLQIDDDRDESELLDDVEFLDYAEAVFGPVTITLENVSASQVNELAAARNLRWVTDRNTLRLVNDNASLPGAYVTSENLMRLYESLEPSS